MRTRRLAAVASTVVMALTLVSCNDTGTSEPDGSVGEQTPTAPPTDDPNTENEEE
jgi:hypothetical protein